MKLVEEIIRDIINSLNEIDAKISILDGNLKIDAKVGTVSNDLIVLIKENKEDLITYLKEGKLNDSFLIPKSPPSEDYPLSPGQQQIWTALKFGGIGAYNLPILLNIEGEIDVSVLKRAIDALLRQHEVLRSVFFEQKNGEARQAIKENWNEDVFIFTDFSVEANAEKSYQLIIKNAVTENFDFAQNLLIRFKLLKISENKYIFICVMHHIISDGWSMNVIVNDIFELYYKISSNQYTGTPKHRIQYKDYAVWQRSRIENGETKIEKDYWLKKLEGSQDPITIQPDKKRPQIKKYEGEIISKALDRNAVSALKELVGTEQATLFMGFLTLAKVLLFKYTAETDIVIGCPISGRNYLELENQIGFYVNTVPYRTQFNAEDSYKSLLKKVKKTTFEAFQYEQFPHEEIASGLNYQGYKYGNPFFNVLLALQNQNNVLNYGFEKNDSNNIKISPFDGESDLGMTSSKFDLIFNFEEADHENMLSIEFDSEIYERKTVERLADHMSILLACVVTDPEIPIKDLLLLSTVEEQELKDYNITQSVYPQGESIISLFEKQVKSTPNHIALIFEDNQLTYKELDEKSNQLSRYLLSRYSLGKGVLCGIKLDRSLDMIVSILAILKSGSGYVPIDVDYPQDRIDYMLEDSGCILVIDSALYADFANTCEYYDSNSLEISISGTDLAYVIYTSGTTGHPKGVMVEHKGVIRLISETNYLPSQKSDVLLSLSTFSFDGSVFDIFYALLNGLQLVVPTKEEMFDFKVLSDIIEKYNVTAFFITTALFNSFVDSELFKISKVQYILFGGEKVSLQHVRKAIEKWPSVQLVHVYGPTENTTFSTFYNVGTVNEDLYTLPIGRAISNSEVFILDDDRNLLPHGVVGEICVSGCGLARGYLNRPDLTAEKFVSHPFKEGERLYRTGDLGRWNYGGYVEFMGRNDDQIKIRGYRIELGEIAQVMSQHPLITNCLVHASEGSSENKELILYYVSESSLSIRDLRSYLSERLPSYMIPGYYLPLDELPLTSNGKVDRKALPMPEDMGIDTGMEYVSPQTSTEKILVKIWSDVLSLDADNIGLYDDFFDLGGHSLKATRLSSQISSRFEVQLGLKELFRYTKLEDQALLIDNSQKTVLASIPQASVQDDYPLSSSQKRMWILSQFEDANLAYNVNGVYEFGSGFDQSAFELAYLDLIVRHESLRTVFRANDQGDIRQLILDPDPAKFQVSYFDFQDRNEADESSQNISDYITEAFDLYNGPLFKAGLFRLSPERLVLAYSMHHIISDGWSLQVMIRELLSLYHAHATGTSSGLLPLRIQYKDYVMWQIMENSSSHYDEMKAYWLGEFSGDLPVLNLAGDYPRPVVKSYKGSTYHTILDKTLTAGLHRVSKNSGATLYMSLLSSINVLLYRYSGDTDIILGCPITGRDHIDLDNQIGFYLNTLAIRSRFSSDDSFTQLLSDVRDTTMNGYKYKGYGFDELVEDLDLVRDISRNPLFDVAVVLQNNDIGGSRSQTEVASSESDPMIVQGYEKPDDGISKFDLTFDFSEVSGELYLFVNYNTDIYNSSTIERMCRHLDTLLRSAIEHPDMSIKDLEILSAADRIELLESFNDTTVSYPQGDNIVSLFEKQAISTPDHVAIVFEEEELTYKELDEKSNQLARYLLSRHSLGRGVLCGIMMDRSLDMIVSILAILKTGSGYVPIDVDYPQDRIDYMVEDSGCILVIDSALYADFANTCESYDSNSLEISISGNDLAYVIYTSGTTGHPKGVMVEHKGVVNLCFWHIETFDVGLHTKSTLYSNYSFDASVWELFPYLLKGASLYIVPSALRLDLIALNNFYEDSGITHSFLPTALCESFIQIENHSLSYLFTGGDRLLTSNTSNHYKLVNNYGPTENSVVSTSFTLCQRLSQDMIPIGSPISNTQLYILDGDLRLVPKGAVGEICVSGSGLARGYLNRPELTAEKFISHPFKEGERLYRTGDLGRWLADGNIEFMGRNDDQVKIRGYRIELGEIAQVMNQHPLITNCLVHASEGSSENKELILYYVSESSLSIRDLRSYLSERLPSYMIPGYYLPLAELPLTSNGKVDRKALPMPEDMGIDTGVEYVSPQTSTEKILVKIWSDVLSLDADNIGLYDDFFDLGGHSLKATRLSSQISDRLHVHLGLKELFRHTKLEDQALLIENSQKTVLASIPQASVQDDYPLSSSQKRMWILSQFEDANLAYNVNGVYEFDSGFDQSAFELAYWDLIVRHESLRTVFRANVHGDIRQLILDPDPAKFQVSYFDFQDRNEADESSQKISEYITEAFDLYNGPLFKAGLFRLSPERLVLAYSMHHIISDGWSLQVMMRELLALYHAHATGTSSGLLPLRIQYKDYVMWQIMENSTAHYDEMKAYWLGEFSGDLPVLNLAGDYPRPVVKSYKGSTYHTILDKTLTAGLHRVSKNSGATLYMSLLSSINVLLYRYSGDTDIILGCPITGRDHIDLDNQIGFYLNTLAIRSRFSSDDSFTQLLSDVRDTTMNGYKYKGYGFDELVEDLDLVRDISRNPLFDVAVVLQNNDIGGSRSQTEVASSESDPMIVQGYEKPDDGISKFDLTFDFSEVSGELYLFVNYNTDIYNSSTIERMCRHLDTLLRSAIEHPDMSIKELEILSAADRIELLESFNDTTVSYPQGDNIVSLFEKQAISTPDHVAIVFEEEELTYKELDEKSNQLARYLLSRHSLGRGVLCGIMMDRSLDMIVSILAILKTGSGYVPIDVDYPQDRIDYMVEDSGCILVIDSALYADFANTCESYDSNSLEISISGNDLAYVIYTSGTTGHPKGVMVEHKGVVNLCFWHIETFDVGPHTKSTLYSNYSFDASVWELFPYLLKGASLYIVPSAVRLDLIALNNFYEDSGITHSFLPTVLCESFIQIENHSLSYLFTGGDRLLTSNTSNHYKLVNNYGPTENSVVSTSFTLCQRLSQDMIPIGSPISNTQLYILDGDLRLVPKGAVGEICVSGSGLARGYLNRPELTAEKFISHPFKEGERLYRTGDLGRWLADGNIEFMGRNDDQVKIRGYRIELGEIAQVMNQHPLITNCLVHASEGSSENKELILYYVSESSLSIRDLRSYLSERLPSYMIPGYYLPLDELPLTSNGKVDRKALPMPEDMGIDTGVEYVSPQTSTEKILVKIWSDVLSLDADSIGIHDHFFDLGGSSLKIMKALELIKATFKKEIKVSILFEYSNIESLAIYINNSFEEIQIEDDFDRDDLLNDLYKLNRDVF